MASYLVQADSNLYSLTKAGVSTKLTLPTGISLTGATVPCRFCVWTDGRNPIIIVVNGGTHDFWIDTFGNLRKMQISSPESAPVLAAGTGSGLNGVYKVAVTFKIKDSNGATVMESGLGPQSAGSASLANQSLKATNIPVSSDAAVNARGLYRTLSGGTTLYPWFDLDDNTTLTDDRDVADSSLSLLPTNTVLNNAPPDLSLCVTWKDRLWGVPRIKPDSVRWTEINQFQQWAQQNELIASPKDLTGVTALIPRRDDLGVAKRRRFYHIVGDTSNNFARVGLSESLGCVSQESVIVNRNVAYFLGERGVVEWSDEGLRYISDELASAWFQTDTFFNRSLFSQAQARFRSDTDTYELFLASAGSSVLDSWVSYSFRTRVWTGPHKTAAAKPTCCATDSELRGRLSDSNLLGLAVFGGNDGNIYRTDLTQLTDNGTAVAMVLGLPYLSGREPDFKKFWGQPAIHTRLETQGALVITPTVGPLQTPIVQTPFVHDLRQTRELLPRLGVGEFIQLKVEHSGTTERPRIYGIEFPYTFLGRR